MANEYTAEQVADGRMALERRGDKWRGWISYYQDGQRRRISRVFPAEVRTEAQAKRAWAAWQRELIADAERRAAQAEAEAHPSWTVPEYVARVIDRSPAEPSTKSRYQTYLRRIRARFDGVPLEDLTADMVADWQDEMAAEGLAAYTIIHAHALLSQAMKYAAEEEGLVPFNPCKKRAARPPKRTHSYPNYLPEAERGRLLDYLEAAPYRPVVLAARIALETGMRRGEVCGLRWRDVDLEHGVIRVSNSIGVRDGGTYEKPPKTGHSLRTIPLSEALTAVLRRRRADQWAQRIALAETTSEQFSGLYVIGDAGGGYMRPDVLSREWSAIARVLDLKGSEGRAPSFHDLRHTFATAAITSDGADVASVSSILGHADMAVTLRAYTAPDADATRRAIDRRAQALAAEAEAARARREREESERGRVAYLPSGTEGRH